jgi:hypothetical protein
MTGPMIDEVCKEAKRVLDELADPTFKKHVITELTEDEIRSWFLLTYKKGQLT